MINLSKGSSLFLSGDLLFDDNFLLFVKLIIGKVI
jgi:hypothetical protein